jgi:peptide deformylase
MLLSIKQYGHPVLQQTAQILASNDDWVKLSSDLAETLRNSGGVGLAAPQIGISKRAFVISTLSIDEQDGVDGFERTYFNPEILWQSEEKVWSWEACLSIPGISAEVLRSEKIRVRYTTIDRKEISEELSGQVARIFQHEYDHLNGILFIDRLSLIKRKLLAYKLRKIKHIY